MQSHLFYDLHLHLLPGLDDGARSLEESLAMARGLADSGFGFLAATPHLNDSQLIDLKRISETQRLVSQALDAQKIALSLDFGGEYAYCARLLSDLRNRSLVTLAGSNLVLMELPESFLPHQICNVMFECVQAGYRPVIAHPERCEYVLKNSNKIQELSEYGAAIQVSFRSLAGLFGRKIERAAWRLLEENTADLLATDAHRAEDIKHVVQPVLARLQQHFGEAANLWLSRNPQLLLKGA